MRALPNAQWVVAKARELGFDLCGVAGVEEWTELARMPEWLERGYAGEMHYLRDPRRESPARVLPGARSVIVTALNYNTAPPYSTESAAADDGSGPRGWISRYAWGEDYHRIIGKKLAALIAAMQSEFAEPFKARAYVDTGPIVERVAAKHAGLGWLAKNTLLINEHLGSWLFLGVIVTTLDLEPTSAPDGAPPDLCGNCRLCIDACPTGAIVEPYVLDARRCISYLTIELRGAIPEALRPPMGRMVFGCDICQDVCPWNRKAPTTPFSEFSPRRVDGRDETRDSKMEIRPASEMRRSESRVLRDPFRNSLFAPSILWLASLTEDSFREIFGGSAIQRAKWRGLVRNACVSLGNSCLSPGSAIYKRVLELLKRLAAQDDPVISEHARWSLARLSAPVRVPGPPRSPAV